MRGPPSAVRRQLKRNNSWAGGTISVISVQGVGWARTVLPVLSKVKRQILGGGVYVDTPELPRESHACPAPTGGSAETNSLF